jgi:DDE family transposase
VPGGRPSHKPIVWYKGFLYQAASWKTARRVVAKVEYHAGELFPRVGFIVTNLETPSRAVVRFYNKRGTAEQWIKEGKQAVKMTRLSCHRFRSNQVRLALSLLAYNLGNLWRRLGLPRGIENWSPDQLAATAGEDWRTAGEACALLLGRFWPCRCGWQTAGSAPIEQSFRNVAIRRDWHTMVSFSRSKRKFRTKGCLYL